MKASTRPTHDSPLADCQRKHRYDSKAQAKRRAKQMRRPTNVYQCPHCGCWHIATRRPTPSYAQAPLAAVASPPTAPVVSPP